jgi:predicted ATPase with chaperone activity
MTTTPLDELKVTREARDRIRAAIVNSGEKWPQMVAVSLPSGSSADLAIAVSILAASGAVPAAALAGVVFLAELGLDGCLRPVPDVPAAFTAAAEGGMHTVVVAAGDAAEAAVPGMRLVVADTLTEVITWLRHGPAGGARQTCGTIGCRSAATHTLTYSFPESREVTATDDVCEFCGDGYLRRPTLKASLKARPSLSGK